MGTSAAIVLAGGASRRMGVDKVTLVVDGRRLVDHVVGEAVGAGVEHVVLAGPDPGDLPETVSIVGDLDPERRGPLAGVSAGWRALAPDAHDPILVLSCDLPRIDRRLLGELIVAAAGDPVGAVAHDGQHAQPLVAAYRRSTIEWLDQAFRSGERSIRKLLEGRPPAIVASDRQVVADVDEPRDLAQYRVGWPDHEQGERGR